MVNFFKAQESKSYIIFRQPAKRADKQLNRYQESIGINVVQIFRSPEKPEIGNVSVILSANTYGPNDPDCCRIFFCYRILIGSVNRIMKYGRRIKGFISKAIVGIIKVLNQHAMRVEKMPNPCSLIMIIIAGGQSDIFPNNRLI